MTVMLLPDNGFAPVSRTALLWWSGAFAAFLIYAASTPTGSHHNQSDDPRRRLLFGWAGYHTDSAARWRRSCPAGVHAVLLRRGGRRP